MSQRTVTDCDKCGKECNPITLKIPNGVFRDSASPSLDVYFEHIAKDLCQDCCQHLLNKILSSVRLVGDGGTKWVTGRIFHPDPSNNDAVGIALEYFGITPKG